LPQTIGGGRIALREIEVSFVCRFDERNAAFIAPDRDFEVRGQRGAVGSPTTGVVRHTGIT